jgi:hypothetical protein
MALTVAEFVVASWLELRLPKQAVVEPVGLAPPSELERNASRTVDQRLPAIDAGAWQLDAAVDVLAFVTALRPIPCVTLRLSRPLSSSFALAVAVQVGHGTLHGNLPNAALGPQDVEVQLTTTSLIATALYTARAGDFDASAGVGARLGFVYLRATTPAQDASLQRASSYAPWGGPALVLGLVYRAGPHVRVVANLEAGFVAISTVLDAPSGEVARIRDGWGVASLGFGWSF